MKSMAKNSTIVHHIPEEFRFCFWDCDFEHLDKEKHKAFIIARLYTKGGIRGIAYVDSAYSLDDITNAAKTRRDLNVLVANYLRQKCGLEKKDMAFYQIPDLPGGNIWRREN